MTRRIAVIVGSLRRESISRKLAACLPELAPPGISLHQVEIGGLALYNPDLEAEAPPAEWVAFRDAIRASDAALFVTPEYNRSTPAALKNAIDVGSRPVGKSVWAGKPVAIVSSSPGQYGGFGANHHLRQSFVFLDSPVLQQPEVYLSHVDKAFGASGNLEESRARELLQRLLSTFAGWIEATARR